MPFRKIWAANKTHKLYAKFALPKNGRELQVPIYFHKHIHDIDIDIHVILYFVVDVPTFIPLLI